MKTLFFLTLPIALTCPALAVDGVVLINQSNALAGNVTPGDAPGFPVTISVSGSYRLSSNLTVPDANTTAIQINTDNVTIDLNGFSILGPVVCSCCPTSCSPNNGSGVGITSSNSNITISNGIVRGFGTSGISLIGAAGRVEGVTASNNNQNGISIGGGPGIVSLCHANLNGMDGISGTGTVSNSAALFNGRHGFFWFGSATGNSSNSNGGSGFAGAGGVWTSNEAFLNNSVGINAFNPSVIISNIANANVGGGISAPSGSVVLNNVQQ
jgi:hypothetical protein